MRAGAERLERYTLLRDSKLWTCRRATAALCEFVIAECSGTALERMRDGFHSEKYLGDLSWLSALAVAAAPRPGSVGQRRMRAAPLLTARKRSFGPLANARA